MGYELDSAVKKVAEKETITIEDIKKLFESFDVQSVFESEELPHSQSLMMFLCSVDQMTVPMMQLFIDKAKKKIGDENNNSNEFLKKQLSFQLNWNEDPRYSYVPFICVACAGSSSLPVVQLIFATCVDLFGKKWLLDQLQVSWNKYSENEIQALVWICAFARSAEVVCFVFSTFCDLAGREAALVALSNVDRRDKTILTAVCCHKLASIESAQLIMDQYSAAGGDDFLKRHLTLEVPYTYGRPINALAIIGKSSSCPERVFNFFITSINNICGEEALKAQLTGGKKSALAYIAAECDGNVAKTKSIISKIIELCGIDALQQLFEAKEFVDGIVSNNKSLEMLELLIETAKDNFGAEFTKQYLLDTNLPGIDRSLLFVVAGNSSAVANLDLVIRSVLEIGGPESLEAMLLCRAPGQRQTVLHTLCSYSTSSKDTEPTNGKLKLLLDQILAIGGRKLLKDQLETVDFSGHACLHLASFYSRKAKDPETDIYTINMLLDAIVFAGGNDLLKKICDKPMAWPKRIKLSTFLFYNSGMAAPRIETVEIILARIVEIGGRALLRSHLQDVDEAGAPPLAFVAEKADSLPAQQFFAALLIELDLFQDQYSKLDDATKEKLKNGSKIESDEWLPSEELKKQVERILQGAIDPNEAERRKSFEEHANATLKQAAESSLDEAARNKAKEERTAATACWKKEHEKQKASRPQQSNEPDNSSSSIPYERMQSGSEETSPKQGCPCVVQ